MKQVHLLIIDPQNDFCSPDKGSLFVPGADQDMLRLATMVDRILLAPSSASIFSSIDVMHRHADQSGFFSRLRRKRGRM